MPRLFSPKVILYLLLLLVMDVTIVPAVPAFALMRPIFLYLFVAYVAFEWHGKKVWLAAFMAGFLRDAMTLQPFGAETISLLLASFWLRFYIRKMEIGSWISKMIGVFFFVSSAGVLTVLLTNGAAYFSYLSWGHFVCMFSAAFASALTVPFFFLLTHRLFQKELALAQRYS